jgi:acetyltransferase-like isoleucine patch superfamily enzyme
VVYSSSKARRQVCFFTRFKVKIGKSIAKNFPYNRIRVLGLKICGFNIGKKVYIGEDIIIASIISEKSCSLKIGNRVAIGPRVTLLLSSDANWSSLMEIFEPITGEVVLEDDCWLGAGVIIMPNVTVGKGAVIGAGAVVTKDIPPRTVFAGIPARKIRNVD